MIVRVSLLCLLLLWATHPVNGQMAAGSKSSQPSKASASAPPIEKPLDDIWPALSTPWFGDLDGIIERGELRVLTAFTLASYFIYKGKQAGTVFWACRELEAFARKRLGDKAKLLKVSIIPVRRDQILPYLAKGYGDVGFANLTITPKRQKMVDFSTPFTSEARELLITGPAAPSVQTLDDLGGKEVIVAESSSYFESLNKLNKRWRRSGKPEVKITPADPRLESEDILEMINAGLLPMTVVDDHRMRLWAQVFDNIVVRDDIVLRENSKIALAMRKKTPQLKKLLDDFVQKYRIGTAKSNILIKRYTENIAWVRPALQHEPFLAFEKLAGLFQKYGKRYDFDWRLLAGFAYQESKFDQSARSGPGAVGVMQVLPSTAADASVGITDIERRENNIHAGSKYLSVLRDQYFSDEALSPFERTLFTMAGYNAGPNRINRLRGQAAERGLDPNKWFNNVELIVAAKVGREPVRYVGNIYRYYVAYKRASVELQARKAAREQATSSAPQKQTGQK